MTFITTFESLELHLGTSKLKSDVVQRILSNFMQNIFCVDDIFQIVVADEHGTLSFITKTLFNSMDIHYKQKLFNVFSVVCDKMVLLNLSSSDSWNLCLKFLISYQYNNYVNGGQMKTEVDRVDNNRRLDLITRCVDIIMESVSPQGHYQCDNKFLFLLKTISKNLFLMGSSKYKLMDQKFPIDDIEYSLNIFIMIHRNNNSDMIIFKLALNKVDIIRMLERFQLSLRDHNEKYNSALLESYYELTELETNMKHFTRKRLELFWRLKMLLPTNSISFPQLMTKLNKILTYKIMTEKEVLIVKKRVEEKFNAFRKRNPEKEIEKLRNEMTNVNDKNRIKYKDMLAMYYDTSNCDNRNNKINRFIRSADKREIRTPFDQFAYKLCLILNTSEMEDWRNEIQKNIKETKQERRFDKSSNKKFCRWLNRSTNRIRNIFALAKIWRNISQAVEVDVQNCDEFGFLAIRRALHVIGEFSKFTQNTKNISNQLSDYMKSVHICLSMGSPQNIRDMLSHNYSLYRIERLDGLKRADYKDMQSDLQSLKYIFSTIHCLYIPEIVRQFNGTLYNCKSDTEANSLLEYIDGLRGVVLPASSYSSDISDLLNDVQENIIPTLNTVTIEDPMRQKDLSRCIENLISLTAITSSISTEPSLAFMFHWRKCLMKLSNLIKLKKYLKQMLHSTTFSLWTSFLQYGHEISILYRQLRTINSILIHGKERDKYEFIWKQIHFAMSTIQEKYSLFLKIDQMKQFLDLEKNNPALELDILRSLDAIHVELGISPIEMQMHDEHPRAMEVLMQALFKHTSIFKINEKYEALKKYFDTMGRQFNSQLEVLKTKEEKYIQQFLDDKIFLASKIGERNRFDSAIEMLLLEILDILHVRNIENNLNQLDEVYPVLCGNNMRNYLAHGNISYEVIAFNAHTTMSEQFTVNLEILNALPENHFKLFDLRTDAIEVPKCKNDWNFDEQLKFIDIQTQLENSVRTLNVRKLRFATRRGAFFHGRNHRGHNIFEIFLNHHLQVYEQYESDKNTLSPEQLDYIEEFFSFLPPDLRLNAKYSEMPMNHTVADSPLQQACAFSRLDVISLLLGKIDIIDLDEKLCMGLILSNDIRVFQMIIPKCRDINVTIDEGLSKLSFKAIAHNCDLDIITYLIENGANKAHRNAEGETMIHMAVYSRRFDVVKYLITNGLDCNVKNNNLKTPLCIACYYGYLEIIDIFLECCQIDNKEIISCLGSAMQNNHNDIAIMLFQKYKTVIDQSGIHGLLIFAICAKNHKIVECFSEEVNFRLNFEEIFHYSIISYDYKIFEILLKCAEKQHITIDQETLCCLLMEAAFCNNFEFVEKLIKMGADYTQKNLEIFGFTILHSLALNPSYDTRALRFILSLKDPGINVGDVYGNTPLFNAITEKNIMTAFLFLKAGADVKMRNNKKHSMLHVACCRKNLEMVELLVRYGAAEQILWKDIDGNTPLDIAAMEEYDEALIHYLEKLSTAQHLILHCKNRRIWFHPKLTLFLRSEKEKFK